MNRSDEAEDATDGCLAGLEPTVDIAANPQTPFTGRQDAVICCAEGGDGAAIVNEGLAHDGFQLCDLFLCKRLYQIWKFCQAVFTKSKYGGSEG